MEITNYLDDFLFISLTIDVCNRMIDNFLMVCMDIGCPVSQEKTERATEIITFLGMLLDGKNKRISIPLDKIDKALSLLTMIVHKRTVTIKTIQKVTGTLNFLNRAIVPGRAFTRMMYTKLKLTNREGQPLKQYHHVSLDQEFKRDCATWITFLNNADSARLCRTFVDWTPASSSARVLNFTSDATRKATLGMGATYNDQWMFAKWDPSFIKIEEPSIEYLELYALTAAILAWGGHVELQNTRVIVFCDNEAVVHMVNNLASSCKHCMRLIRMIALNGIINNRRLFVRHIKSKDNFLLDALSRMNFSHFWRLAPPTMNTLPDVLPAELWPMSKVW